VKTDPNCWSVSAPATAAQAGGSCHPRRGSSGGSVTAEAALVLPLIAVFALALLWLVSVGITKVETVDAARDAARALARGDDLATARANALGAAPAGAEISIESSTDEVTATVSVHVQPPGWLLVHLPTVTVSSAATTQLEPGAQPPGVGADAGP
jgi:TadE-like protein